MGTGMDDSDPYAMSHEDENEDIYDDVEDDEQFEDQQESFNDRLTGRRQSRTIDHPANSEEARAKRIERQKKHDRKESVKPPDLFGDQQSDPEDYMDDDDEYRSEPKANKRRSSQILNEEYMDDEALAKREQRQAKAHRRQSSVATPNLFADKYDPVKTAKNKAKK